MGLLDEAKDLMNTSMPKATERFSGQNDSDRSGGRNQGSGGNPNLDDSRYGKSGSGYDQSDDYKTAGSGMSGGRYDKDENVGSGYQARDNIRASQADSIGDSGYNQSRVNFGSTADGTYGAGTDRPSDDFGARGGVSAGGVGDSHDSTTSGGYGANSQGDSFSRKNQAGFDNEFSSSGGY
ncbi:hypothetical protein PTTG_02025 [Puccinia triticina 1-1 BBBD Race 1]|uniref:Uncharacterized protein n=2 Tax=Puccinia triticina TaxID=208348 RepID=A0A180GSK8_PUCT1|nr:uncharacterized protein PtA15_14A250 [Puccinia triticina]OAV95786.1 hypothetical protein PTTG_02025 [Puccinia triticina 1-1 BBBD Race 1]WAQ91367.1 hypothetical protein PtA15_14A250 [Puccinia triticina]WAR62167.1 hypothetical protein PtB15_14B261 [Puccinia triticina]